MGDQQRRHPGLVEAHADAITGRAGLGHLELGRTDAVPVADADLVVGQPVHGEVLAEDAVGQIGPAEEFTPMRVRTRPGRP